MRQSPKLIAFFCLVVSGCGYFQYEPLNTPDSSGYLLQPVNLTHEVHFLPGETEVASEEKERLSAFLDEVDPKDEAEIWIDAAGDRGKPRRSAVRRVLEHFGRTDVAEGASPGRSDAVTVIARRQVVLPKTCVDPSTWPDPRLLPASCATMLNLMASVENQHDLIQGREAGLASGSTAAAALQELLRNRPPAGSDGSTPDRREMTLSSP